MRAIFGLAGLLIFVGVIVWWWGSPGGELDQTRQALQAGNKAKEQVSQLTGSDPETGRPAGESAVLEGSKSAGRLSGLLVSRITSGGAYERYFGLKRNDTITAIEYAGNRMNISKDLPIEQDAKVQVEETYRHKGSVYVMRDGKELKLPAAAPAAAGQPRSKDELQQQLDAIQNVPR